MDAVPRIGSLYTSISVRSTVQRLVSILISKELETLIAPERYKTLYTSLKLLVCI